MPTVKMTNSSGLTRSVSITSGESVMRGALDNGVEEILGECGGALVCATCHAYVVEPWQDRLPSPSEMEQEMLECAAEPRPNSRLTCQIRVTEDIDGLEIELPDSQF